MKYLKLTLSLTIILTVVLVTYIMRPQVEGRHPTSVVDDSDTLYAFDRASLKPFEKFHCPKPTDPSLETPQMFFDMREICRRHYGDKVTVCVEQDPARLEKRLNNPQLMDQIIRYTRETFDYYKKKLGPECCGTSVNCLDRFDGVVLDIKEDQRAFGQYFTTLLARDPPINVIELSRPILAKQYTEERVERILLHEMGHVCQYALTSNDEEVFREFSHKETRCIPESGQIMFKEVFGDEVAACIIGRVKQRMNIAPEGACLGKWFREAFADMRFRHYMDTPYHWLHDLTDTEVRINYAGSYYYADCLLPKDFKSNFCKE